MKTQSEKSPLKVGQKLWRGEYNEDGYTIGFFVVDKIEPRFDKRGRNLGKKVTLKGACEPFFEFLRKDCETIGWLHETPQEAVISLMTDVIIENAPLPEYRFLSGLKGETVAEKYDTACKIKTRLEQLINRFDKLMEGGEQ